MYKNCLDKCTEFALLLTHYCLHKCIELLICMAGQGASLKQKNVQKIKRAYTSHVQKIN